MRRNLEVPRNPRYLAADENPFVGGFGASPVVLEQNGLKVPVPDPFEYEAQLLAMLFDHPPALRYPAVQNLDPAHWLDYGYGVVFGLLKAMDAEGNPLEFYAPMGGPCSAFRSNPMLAGSLRQMAKERALWDDLVEQALTVASMGSAYPGEAQPHAELCAEKIREAFVIRQELLAFAAFQARMVWADPMLTAAKVATQLAGHLDRIRASGPEQSARSITEVLLPVAKALPERQPLTSTGFPRLDWSIGGGFEAGRCYGLMGSNKAGKTAFAGSISHNLRVAGVKHLFVALELGSENIALRELSRLTRIPTSRYRHPQFWKDNPDVRDQVEERILEMRAGQDSLLLVDQTSRSLAAVREAVESATLVHRPEGVFIDYLQLVAKTDGRITTAEHIDHVAYWVSEFCRRYRVWAFVNIQTNQADSVRGGEGPRMAFDMLWRIVKEKDSENLAHLVVEASRFGPGGSIGSAGSPAYQYHTEYGPFWEEMPEETMMQRRDVHW